MTHTSLKALTTALLILTYQSAAWSQPSSQPSQTEQKSAKTVEAPPKSDKQAPPAEAPSSVPVASESLHPSEDAREGKSFQLNVQLFGIGPAATSSAGFQFGFFIDRNRLFQLETMSGSSSFSGSTSVNSVEVSSYSGTKNARSFGAHYKRFVSNSFYWRAGAEYISQHIKRDYKGTGYTGSYDIEITRLAGTFVIGNQWQWDNFTLGCDWFGVTAPISSQITSETISGSRYDGIEGDIEIDRKGFIILNNLNLLRFYLGFSW